MALPFFFVPIGTWIVTKFGSVALERSFKLAAAVFYIGLFAIALAAIAGFMTVISVPPVMSTAFSILAPSDWAAQLGVVVAARGTSLAWHAFRQAFFISQQ